MKKIGKKIPFIERDFASSIDEFLSNSPYWKIDMTQTEPGDLMIERIRVFSEELRYLRMSSNRKILFKGQSPQELKTFILASSTSQTHIYYRREIGKNQIVVVPDNGEIDGTFYPGYDIFVLSMPKEDLKYIGIMAGVKYLEESLTQGAIVTPPTKDLHHLQDFLNIVDELTKTNETQDWFRAASESIKSAIASCLAPITEREPLPPHKSRDKAVHTTMDFIEEHIKEPLTIKDLCLAANVSERTLLYAFRERLDVTPKEYLQARKMGMINKALLSGESASVTDVATEWGFWHLSQFASDYKKQFGELPSDTLKKVSEKT